jgi:hypothetical protein
MEKIRSLCSDVTGNLLNLINVKAGSNVMTSHIPLTVINEIQTKEYKRVKKGIMRQRKKERPNNRQI